MEKLPKNKSFVRVIWNEWEEHNLTSLLDLLRKNRIIIKSITAKIPDEWGSERITDSFIPSVSTKLTVEATYWQVHDILKSSKEFGKYVDKLLWVV